MTQRELLEQAERAAADAGLELRRNDSGLLELAVPGGPAVTAAWTLLQRPRPGSSDPLWRALLAGKEQIVDATAGLGSDAFHLAAKGAEVTLIERSPVLAALLADTLAAARSGLLGPAAVATAERLELLVGDAAQLLTGAAVAPAGVVYLDPMFDGVSGSAAPPKGMAVLRRLFAEDEQDLAEESALLRAARATAAKRVVVKRALRAAPLAQVPPSGSLRGRTVRYDLYAPF